MKKTSRLLSILLTLALMLSLTPVNALSTEESSLPDDPVILSEENDPAIPVIPGEEDPENSIIPGAENGLENPVIPDEENDPDGDDLTDVGAPGESTPVEKISSAPVMRLGAPSAPDENKVTIQPVSGTVMVGEQYSISYATNFEYINARLYEGNPNASHTFRKMLSTSGSDTVPAESSQKTITFYVEFQTADNSYYYTDLFDVTWKSFVVNFDAYGGSGSMESVYTSTTSIQTINLPECGFKAPSIYTEFAYWVVIDRDANTTLYEHKAPGDPIIVDRNLSVQARWKSKMCTVTFDMNGHGTAPEPQTVESLKWATEPAAPTAEGWEFGGWYAEPECTNLFNFYHAITKDVTVYAKWTKLNVVGDITDLAATVTLPVAGAHPVLSGTPGDSTIYEVLKVMFEDEGGHELTATDTFEDGKTYKVLVRFKAKEGNNITSSTSAKFNGITASLQIILADGSRYYYIKYTVGSGAANHTVTFNANGHGTAPAAQTVNAGETAIEPTAPTESGYTFEGWYTEADCINPFDFSTVITGDITLYAKWTAGIPVITITQQPQDITVTEGSISESVSVTATITPDQELKYAWFLVHPMVGRIGLEGKSSSISIPTDLTEGTYEIYCNVLAESTILESKHAIISVIKAAETTHTVTFKDGETILSTATVNDGAQIAKPTDPTKEGFTFEGWYADAAFSTAFNFNTFITADITLYAKWTEESVPTTYNVKMTGGYQYGTMKSEFTAQENDYITIHADVPQIPAGKYVEKFTDEAKGFTVGEMDPHFTMPAYDLDLKAVYADQTDKVIDLSSGTADIPTALGHECPFIDSTGHNPFYQPVGTQLDVNEDGTPDIEITNLDDGSGLATLKSLNSGVSEIRQNLAGYKYIFVYRFSVGSVTHTVTFKDGETTLSTDTVNDGDKVTKPADPTKTGYTFDGWYADAAFLSAFDFETAITADTAVYAKFTEDSIIPPAPIIHTVTVSDDGNGTGSASPSFGETGTEVTLAAMPNSGYQFKEWQVISGGVTIIANKFSIGTEDVEVKAVFKEIPAITYTVTVGADSTWTRDSGTDLTIIVKRSEADETCFSHFTGVQIDGTTLAPSDYDAKAGSTVVTLKEATLLKLSNGNHTITVNFDDGKAETKLSLKDTSKDPASGKPASENPTSGNTDKGNSGNTDKVNSGNTAMAKSGNTGVAASPKTGDSTPLVRWSLLLITAAAAIAVLALLKRRRNAG